MTTSDPDNDGDTDTPGQPDIDPGNSPPFVLGIGYGGWPRPLKSVRQHKRRMRAPAAQADAPPEIGTAASRGRRKRA